MTQHAACPELGLPSPSLNELKPRGSGPSPLSVSPWLGLSCRLSSACPLSGVSFLSCLPGPGLCRGPDPEPGPQALGCFGRSGQFPSRAAQTSPLPKGPGGTADVLGWERIRVWRPVRGGGGRWGSHMEWDQASGLTARFLAGRCPVAWVDPGPPAEGEVRSGRCWALGRPVGTSSSSVSCAGGLIATFFLCRS